MSGDDQDAATSAQPVLRVVKGDPTPEELAALVAVVAARNAAAAHAAAAAARPRPRSEWGHPVRAHRTPHRVGPDAWRRSAWA
ncbi:hypothetical protein GCM10009821_07090 [Aeromicrobium halocynthiae]|uniref:Acyl-CoA carboxylase subunit epsilon n=1 Tax=Aeromicrobium halocynthiae TaxID=560557 RepID=A0ABP5HCF4_9ACTN